MLNPTADAVFLCPGEPHPISRSVHEARLSAGWSGCDHCPSRHDPAVTIPLARASSGTGRQKPVIRRTPWGVRGPWQNAITRLRAGQLAAIITSHLTSDYEHQETAGEQDDPETDQTALERDPLTLVAGYDGRSSSPDIFAGVVSAVLHNGWNVMDIGHATAASIQEALRTHSSARVAILVTGAGESACMTGLDVFDRQGRAVSVPWQSFGVKVRQLSTAPEAKRTALSRPAEHLQTLRAALQSDAGGRRAVGSVDDEPPAVVLELPYALPSSASRFRISRTSGELETQNAEQPYRRWLGRWFPAESADRISCLCFDALVADRLHWLSASQSIHMDIVHGTESQPIVDQLSQRVHETHSDWGIAIADDDRSITVANRRGRILTAKQLTHWINSSVRTTQSHLTTHVPDNDDRLVMLDAGRTTGHDVISDGLAALGLIARITASGSPLPDRAGGE